MIKKINLDIPAKSLGYLFVCGGIIIVLALGLVSFHRYNFSRSQDVKKIQDQIDEQKGLGQMYQLLQSAAEKKEVRTLPNPAKTKLSRQHVERFQDAFRAQAGKSGLMTISLLPDFKSIADGSQSLLYNSTLKGEFANFRKLLAGFGNFSYLDHVEEIQIKQYGDSMEFKVKIWVALAK